MDARAGRPLTAPEPDEGPSTVRAGRQREAPLLLPQLPREVAFGFLGRLLPTSRRDRARLELYRMPRRAALDLVRDAGAVAEAELVGPGASTSPAELAAELESSRELAGRVADREQELFRVGVVLGAEATSARGADRSRAELARRAEALGFGVRRPLYEAAAALRAEGPWSVAERPSGYWHTLPTDGVAAFFPFVDEAVAEPGGLLAGLLLGDAAPVFLDRWAHASHSWGIFGTTGAGKTFLAALLALRSRWLRPELDLVVVDPLGEFAGFVRALGGDVVAVGRPGAPRLNPLDPTTTEGDAPEKAARVGAALRALFPSLRDDEAARLDRTVAQLYDAGGEPTFSDLARRIGPESEAGRLATFLEVFTAGSLRHLDGPTTVRWEEGPVDLDLSAAAEAHLPFHLAYALDAVLGRLRRRSGPKLVVVDEAHLLARDPPTAAFLDRLVRHMRHYEAGLLLLSQNPDDFLATESGRSLLRNLRATLLLRLPEVSDAARAFFRLTPAEAEWLPRARLPREAGYSEALLRLGPSHLPIACVASTPEYDFLVRALGAGIERS